MTALRAVVVGPSLLSGWTVPPERGTSEAEGVSGLESSFTLRRLACGEVGHSGRLAIRRGWPFGEVGLAGRLAIRGGDPLPPLGYSPFQVGESMRSVGAGELFYLAGRVALRGGDPLPLRGLFHYSFPLALPQGRGVLPLSGGRVRAGCGLALLLLDPLCPSGISPFMGRAMRGVGGCGLF